MNEIQTWEYPSSSGGPPHVVTKDGTRGTCTCQGFKYRRTCKHITETFPPRGENLFLAAALAYAGMGYHVIPIVPREKMPIVRWKDFQETAPTLTKIRTWWARTPDANVGFVLGQCRLVVDFDGGEEAETLLADAGIVLPVDAPRSKTRSGFHVFLSAPTPQPDKIGLLRAETERSDEDRVTPGGRVRRPQVDIRGLGIIIAPPSVHPSGAIYEWLVPLRPALPLAPAKLLELIALVPEAKR